MNCSKRVCYKRLWKLLIDREIKKKDLCAMARISPASVTKMGKNGHVTTEVLSKICCALDCDIGDIMEIIECEPPRGINEPPSAKSEPPLGAKVNPL